MARRTPRLIAADTRWSARMAPSKQTAMNKPNGKAQTGIWGLDDVLDGGLSRGNVFLLEGEPGTGKTTVGLQFLLAGLNAGEHCLYVTLSESEKELRAGAA